jgi:hypothetical protein
MSVVSEDAHLNQLASDWMHRGMDLAKENSAATLERAVRCFDEAIVLRRTLPLEENHFYRYGLSAGWINRGDALARRGGSGFAAEAVKSYDEALTLLESLPLEENALYPRRLAITWINRGTALQQQEISGGAWEAVECFREAIDVLEHSSAAHIADQQNLLAGAWGNLAGALMSSGEENADGIRLAAHKALALVEFSEKTDAVSAEVSLKVRHLLCRLVVKDIADQKPLSNPVIEEATDAVEEALALARIWKLRGETGFDKLAREIFRFGCRIYENGQPHFLGEFLMECLSPEGFDAAWLLDEETAGAAQAAIWEALGKLQLEGFRLVATPHFESFLSNIQELRRVEERLKQVRSAQTN